jgi:hypothetical protein
MDFALQFGQWGRNETKTVEGFFTLQATNYKRIEESNNLIFKKTHFKLTLFK